MQRVVRLSVLILAICAVAVCNSALADFLSVDEASSAAVRRIQDSTRGTLVPEPIEDFRDGRGGLKFQIDRALLCCQGKFFSGQWGALVYIGIATRRSDGKLATYALSVLSGGETPDHAAAAAIVSGYKVVRPLSSQLRNDQLSGYLWISNKEARRLASESFGNAKAIDVTECEVRQGMPDPLPLEKAVAKKLNGLKQCERATDDRTACNVFLGKALEELFGNTDFKVGRDSYMLANDITIGLEQPGNAKWRKIGLATDQVALDEAQRLANESKPVVAARFGASGRPGHVALVMPGTSQLYNFEGFSWGALRAPNSASFFLDQPRRFFVGCPLSAVWRKPDNVGLFYKP